jgi:hypothetical protein
MSPVVNTHLLTPAAASATTADVCAAVVSVNGRPTPPVSAWLESRGSGQRTPIAAWREWLVPDGSAGVLSARLQLNGLAPRSEDQIDLYVDGALASTALVSTLPDRLPTVGEKPLTMMLGSCFCVAEDQAGRAGRRFATLPGGLRPDLKLLCGDQVYLDAPFYRFLLPHSRQRLAESFLERYRDTWTQSGDREGFRQVLSTGPAFFTADDHEFWNNAPFPSFAVDTWSANKRRAWWDTAAALFDAFQTTGGAPVQQVDIGDLSVFIADTRITRRGDRTTFLDPAGMQALTAWAAGLSSPGVLVIGQPVFAKKAGWRGHIADWNLPDFDQYRELCAALLGAPQSIVLLTGDVHYGRVATARTTSGHELIEIIASPMSLVTAGGSREWKPAPALFPHEALPGLVQANITSESTWQRAADHFLTLELWQEGGRLEIKVRTWETAPDADTPSSPVFEYALQRRT